MPPYIILWKPSALKEVEKLHQPLISRILLSIEALATHPFPSGSRKLQGSENSYRIRVGDYRVIYNVLHQQIAIEVIRIRHRKDAYR